MSIHPPIFIVHSANLWGMMRRIVGLMTSCMKDQGIHIEFKESYKKEGTVAQFNSLGRGNFNPRGGFIGRGQGGSMSRGRG
jgi:hypothetical protein